MIDLKQRFKWVKSPDAIDTDRNDRVMKCIWGKPAVINGVRLKEHHFIMIKDVSTGKVMHTAANTVSDAIRMIRSESIRTDQNIYMSANTFVNKSSHYTQKTLFSIKNICVDIDDHNSPPQSICNTVNILLQELIENHGSYGLPLPNAAVYTGRGLQLWYCIESTSYKLSFLTRAIVDRLCDLYESLLASMPITFADLSVDRGVSGDITKPYRVPGTYNPSAHCYSQGILISTKRWDINQLREAAGVVMEKCNKRSVPVSLRTVKSGSDTGSPLERHRPSRSRFAAHLLSLLEEAARTGSYKSREVLCHIYHSVLLTYGISEEVAEEKVSDLNQMFPEEPLSEKQMNYMIKCNVAHRYKYSEATILERIGMPDEMINKYKAEKEALKKPQTNAEKNLARDLRTYKKNMEWHNDIRILAIQGRSKKEIAEITGRNIKTVRKYAGTPMETLDDFYSRYQANQDTVPARSGETMDVSTIQERVKSLYGQGFRSPVKIARILDTDEQQVRICVKVCRDDAKAQAYLRQTVYIISCVKRDLDKFLRVIPWGTQASSCDLAMRIELRDIQSRICSLERKIDPYLETHAAALPDGFKQEVSNIKEEVRHVIDRCNYYLMT